MNSNKLSNTGMLKIASKWVKLLRDGKLSIQNLNRINQHANRGPLWYGANTEMHAAVPTALQGRLEGIREGLKHNVYKLDPNYKFLKTTDLKDKISGLYDAAAKRMSGAVSRDEWQTKQLFRDHPWMPNFLKNPKSKNHKVWGVYGGDAPSGIDSYFVPEVRGIYLNRAVRKTAPFIPRHETAHAFHALAPEVFKPDAVKQVARLTRTYPHAIENRFLEGSLASEAFAHAIASRGPSSGAKRFIRQNFAYNPTHLDLNDNAAINNIVSESLKTDPSGRMGAILTQLHKNYLVDVPRKYKYPELFNLNPYLP